MTYRTTYEIITVTAETLADYPGYRVGDSIEIRREATQVDHLPFAQLADMLGAPYPDKPDERKEPALP